MRLLDHHGGENAKTCRCGCICGFLPNLGSRRGQQQVVSTAFFIGGTGVHEGKTEKEERLCFPVDSIAVDMYYAFLEYKPLSGGAYVV